MHNLSRKPQKSKIDDQLYPLPTSSRGAVSFWVNADSNPIKNMPNDSDSLTSSLKSQLPPLPNRLNTEPNTLSVNVAPHAQSRVITTENTTNELDTKTSSRSPSITPETSTSGAPAIRKAIQRLHVHQSVYFPNLPPAPVNGMIKTYGTQHRTFTRPHSAKTVFFYKDNDIYYTGLRVPVSKSSYRTIDSLLDQLNQKISLPFGVRHLHTPHGRTPIKSLDQLEHLGRYVVSSTRFGKGLDMDALDRRKREREMAQRYRNGNISNDNQAEWSGSNRSFKARITRASSTRQLGSNFLPTTSKQIYFVLNGQPSKIHRYLLNPTRTYAFDNILSEVSRGLRIAINRLYTYDGELISSINQLMDLKDNRVLSVPRNERLLLHGRSYSELNKTTALQNSLPPIRKPAHESSGSSSGNVMTTARKDRRYNPNQSSQQGNSIERPLKAANLSRRKRYVSSVMSNRQQKSNQNTEKDTSQISMLTQTITKPVNAPLIQKQTRVTKRMDRRKGPHEKKSESVMAPVNTTIAHNSNSNTADSDSGRPRSSNDFSNAGATTTTPFHPDDDFDEDEENDEEIEGDDELEEQDSADDYPQQPNELYEIEAELAEEEDGSKRYGSAEEKAAIKIQAATRGYLARKQYKIVRFQVNEPNRDNKIQRVSTPILAPKTSESSVIDPDNIEKEEELHAENVDEEPKTPNIYEQYEIQYDRTESANSSDDEDEDELLAKRTKGPNDVDSYSVTVKLGNRWAADSETELYISMIGDKKESDKFYMRQKYVNWLESEQLNYVQQSSDTFQMQIECGFLGIIQKLVVGHDSPGYGAGIFIDRIIVTEDATQGRAYLFQCHKWLDSGQVDGKLERILRLTAYCDMDSIQQAIERVTRGRYEVVLHSGDSKGNGGTTSNLRLVGFGTRGSDQISVSNEPELRQVPSKTLVQCHFKDIGELLKLRIEIDGNGNAPDYFIDYIELRDLDTQDRCVVMCGKWLKWKSTQKGEQPFREFLTFRLGAEPLPLITYDGKLRLSEIQFKCIEPIVKLELVGDIAETGIIWLDLETAVEKGGKMEVSFKIEAVSIGKLNASRLYMSPTEIGEQIYEGFSVLQTIWEQRHSDINGQHFPIGTTGNDWLIGSLYIREGSHTPYRYVLNSSRIRPRKSEHDPFIKELRRSALEGMPTRASKRKVTTDHVTPSWLLSLSVGEDSRLLPHIFLCGTKDTAQMKPISETAVDNFLSYQLKDSDLGNICKVRLKTDSKSLLKVAEDIKATNNNAAMMRLSDTINGDEIRFPSADVEMDQDSIVEFPTFWPDRPPLPNIVYEIHLATGDSNISSDVPIWLNIFGDYGDVSYRRLQKPVNEITNPLFSPDSVIAFEFEAVSIGVLKTAEITVECDQPEFIWECTQLTVGGSLNGESYVFHFSRPFTAQNNRQNASAILT